MKKIIPLLALLSFVVTNVRAATNFVILGDDFQTKIDAAAPGDTLVVQAGVYPGNLNFNKPLTVLRSGTNQIQLLGTVQITGAGNSSFQFSQFASAVTIQATGTASFAQSQFLSPVTTQSANLLMSQVTASNIISANLMQGSGTNFQAYDSSLWQLEIIGGKTVLKRCSLYGGVGYTLTLSSNAAFEGLRVTNNGVFYASATVGSSTPFVATQSRFEYALQLSGYNAWFGYSDFTGLTAAFTNCNTVMIGNVINGSSVYCEAGKVKAYNNNFNVNGLNCPCTFRTLWLHSADGELVNNSFRAVMNLIPSHWIMYYDGCYFSGGGTTTIRSCIFSVTDISPNGTKQGLGVNNAGSTVTVSYCDFFTSGIGASAYAGVNPVNSISVDPLLNDGALLPGSPCINAGPPDAIFNDRNSTRNDMGYTGGPYWNPANYTNDNPMVFFLTGSPQTVFKGVQTNILVNVGAAAGH